MPIQRNQHLRTILALAGLSTIVGCASLERTVTEDGSEVFAVICDGNSRGANFCLEKAGRTCAARNGYKIMRVERARSGGSGCVGRGLLQFRYLAPLGDPKH